MNNVITFFIDSLAWNSIATNQAKVSPTPFLDSLAKDSLTCSKLYSHGPYTDAATRSLFTGRNCLDDFGYFFKLNTSPITHYKAFHDAGYETYDFNYPFYIIGDGVNKYIDHSIHTASFIYGSELGGIFNYYFEIVKKRALENDEYLLLKDRLQYLFESWQRYLEDALHRPETFVLHNKILKTYDAKEALNVLIKERDDFKANPHIYIDNMLLQGHSHVFETLDNSGVEPYINHEFIDNYIEKKYGKFIDRAAFRNFCINFVYNFPSPKRFCFALRRYLKTKDSTNFLFLTNFIGSLFPFKLMRKRWKEKDWQNQHTAHTVYEEGINILMTRKSDKPFYFFFDVEEPHNNIAFHSYDITDKGVIDAEMQVMEDYVKKVGFNFKGSLLYLMSLRYTDYQIEKFCKKLKEMGLWENTTIMVIADHGSSYTFNPIHNNRVNCFDDECYHIPMLIHHPGMKGKEITSYQYSKDVLPTLMDVVGLEPCKEFKGRSMLRETEERKFVIGEYMGPGCPDMLHRRIWFSARDENYIIAYKVALNEDFEQGELAEVYDLKTDPKGYYNINDKIEIEKIQYLLNPLKERWKEIGKDTGTFMENLRVKNKN